MRSQFRTGHINCFNAMGSLKTKLVFERICLRLDNDRNDECSEDRFSKSKSVFV